MSTRSIPNYSLPKNPNIDITSVLILEGEYKGLLYQYGEVQFIENEAKTDCTLHFVVDILDNPMNIITENNSELTFTMGDILVDIIEQQLSDRDLMDEEI